MSVSDKKYYWLKLKKDFFKRHDIKIIESRPNGEKYVLFYLKLLVESIDHEGALRFNETIPYNDEMLSTITNTDIDVVRTSVKLFTDLGMMEVFDDGTLYMQEIQKMIGHETYWAKKKREQRNKPKLIELENVQSSPKCPSKSIDIELDKELDIDIDKDKNKNLYRDVIKYLNEKGNKSYRHTTQNTKKLINGRIKDGFTEKDFYQVIDNMVSAWVGTDYEQYLRPQTLFAPSNFEKYLYWESKKVDNEIDWEEDSEVVVKKDLVYFSNGLYVEKKMYKYLLNGIHLQLKEEYQKLASELSGYLDRHDLKIEDATEVLKVARKQKRKDWGNIIEECNNE